MKFRIGNLELEWRGDSIAGKVSGKDGKSINIEIPLPEGAKKTGLDIARRGEEFFGAVRRDIEDSG